MKPAKPKRSAQELDARYMKLNRERTRVVYMRMIAQNEGNMEAYNELDKRLSDLNEDIAALEQEARI